MRVLLVRLDGIGDAAVCVPLVAALREAGHAVGIASTTRNAGLFVPGALIAEHVLDRIAWPAHGSTPDSTARAAAQIAAAKYDVALIASEEPEAFGLAAPVRERVGFTTGWSRPFKTLWVRGRTTRTVSRSQRVGGEDAHEVEIIYRLGAGLVRRAAPPADVAQLAPLLVAPSVADAVGGRAASRAQVGCERRRGRRAAVDRRTARAAGPAGRRGAGRRGCRRRRARRRPRDVRRPARMGCGAPMPPRQSSRWTPGPRTSRGCSACRSSTSSPTRTSTPRSGAGARGRPPIARCGRRSCAVVRVLTSSNRSSMAAERALLVAAGGGIGDTLLAGVVARALRMRYEAVDAVVLARTPTWRHTSRRSIARSSWASGFRRATPWRSSPGRRCAPRCCVDRAHPGTRRAGPAAVFAAVHRPCRPAQRARRSDDALDADSARLRARDRLRHR